MAQLKQPPFRIGIGFDAHRLKSGRKLILGGIHIPHPLGLAGHSDADALLHAVADALLSTAALPDIGTLFPDTDPRFKDADSKELLRQAYARVRAKGCRVCHLSCVLVCDHPKLSAYVADIRASIARILRVPNDAVGLSAKTTEGTQLALKNKSIAAFATCLVMQDVK